MCRGGVLTVRSVRRLGEETCSLEPRSADHCTALGALLLADAACGAAGLARADLVHHYLELFRCAGEPGLGVVSNLSPRSQF